MGFFDEVNNQADIGATYKYKAPPKAKKKASFLQSLLPSAGGIAGGVGGGAAGGALAGTAILPGIGTVAGGLIGALLGGSAGGAAGKIALNKSLGEGAFNDVGKEAAMQGVLSAGPLRLLKGATAATQAAKGGADLAEALTAGGARAAAPSAVKTAVSNKLGNASENMASKALGITKGQKNTILEKTGEKAGAIAKKYGIATAEDVPKVTKGLYADFNATVKAIPRTFSKSEVEGAFKGVYEPLMAKGQPLGHQAVGERIKAEADNMLKGVSKDGISATELNAKRQAFDTLAYKAKGTDPNLYDVNKNARDVLSNLVHGAADSAGIKTASGKSLKELGKEIRKVKRLGEAANKNIEGAGGSMQIGLGSTPLAIVGSGGGPVGAAAGLGVNMAINSGAGRRAISAGLEKATAKTAGSAIKTATNPYGTAAVTKRIAPVGLAGALTNQASAALPQSENSASTDMTAQSAMMPTSSMSPDYSANADPSTQSDPNSPFAPQNVEANVAAMVQKGAKMSDIKSYLDMAKTIQAMTGGDSAGKPLNSTQQQQSSNAQSGLASLQTIADTLSKNPNATKLAALPGGSLTGSLTGTGEYKAAIANATDVIGRLRSGGAIQRDEERRFLALLPQAFDDPQTAQYKLNQVSQLFQKFANPASASPDASSLLSALGA
jgi:hypothetical protein